MIMLNDFGGADDSRKRRWINLGSMEIADRQRLAQDQALYRQQEQRRLKPTTEYLPITIHYLRNLPKVPGITSR